MGEAKTKKVNKEKALEDKKKAFAENPDNFIEIKKLVCSVYFDDKGQTMLCVNPSYPRRQLLLASAEIAQRVTMIVASVDAEAKLERSGIITKKEKKSKGIIVP